ncbi:MAG: hypothetical protein KA165_00120 [Saprospiraceae bacterium]|nr:hypothetical protein [Saprospiraceae bacterium]
MKPIKFFFGCIAMLAFSFHLQAQKAAPAPKTFFFVDYLKTTPGHATDYIKLETEVWKDIHKSRIKKGIITGWYFLEVRFPSGTETEYDYVTVTAVKGWTGIDSFGAGWLDAYRALTAVQQKRADSTNMFRNLVRTEVWTTEEAIFKKPAGSVPPKYWFVNTMDVHDGKWDAYVKMEKDLVKPVQQEQINTGHRAGWGVYSLVFPWGAEAKYEAVAIDYFETWSDAVADDTGAIWKKVHPKKTAAEIDKTIEGTRTLAKGEVRVLLDYAQ